MFDYTRAYTTIGMRMEKAESIIIRPYMYHVDDMTDRGKIVRFMRNIKNWLPT